MSIKVLVVIPLIYMRAYIDSGQLKLHAHLG